MDRTAHLPSLTAERQGSRAGSIPPKIVFAAADLPADFNDNQRFSLWRDTFTSRFGAHLDIKRLEDAPFDVRAEFGLFGDVVLSKFESTAMRIVRGPQAVKADGNDCFVLFLNRGRSRIAVRQKERQVLLGQNAAAIITHTEPGGYLAEAENAQYILTVPRDRLLDLVVGPEDMVALPLEPDSAALRLLRRYLDIVAGIPDIAAEPALADHVGQTISDLIGIILGVKRDIAELARLRGLRAARLQAVLQEIMTGFADPAFCSERVARKLGVSPRYVQDLLQTTGQSFTERVTELRLQKARRMLQSSGLAVTEIIYAAGFNDISYFNRRFRRRFGTSPTQLRGLPKAAEARPA
jgi:AraC-like DNA-binding protein